MFWTANFLREKIKREKKKYAIEKNRLKKLEKAKRAAI